MFVQQKANPKMLTKLPLFSTEGEVVTNGITSPHHMILSCDGEQSGQIQISLEELEAAKLVSVEESVKLSSIDSRHIGLEKEYELELERIDQQLLELGPYALDAFQEEAELEYVHLLVSPPLRPPDTRRGKRGRPVAQHKAVRNRPSRVSEEFPDTQRGGWREATGGWREMAGGWREIPDGRPTQELPKKKWRKVGSAGPAVRGKEGQLDAQSDPLNVSSANIIITPASDLEMRGLYQPTQGNGVPPPEHSRQRASPGDRDGERSAHVPSPRSAGIPHGSPLHIAQTLDHHGAEERQHRAGGIHGYPGEPTAYSVATTAHSTPSCNTTPPSDTPGHSRTQPTAHWKPVPRKPSPSTRQDLPHPLQEGYTHLPQHVQMDSSEEVDVTWVESDESPKFQLTAAAAEARRSEGLSSDPPARHEACPPPAHVRREPHSAGPGHPTGRQDWYSTSSPSPKTNPHGQRVTDASPPVTDPHSLAQHQHPSGLHKPQQPGFSISHLTKGPEIFAQSPAAHEAHLSLEYARGSGGPGDHGVMSPHGDIESHLMRKRRLSSSSSHRSASARSGSPLSASHPRGQFVPGVMWEGGTATPSPTTKDKPPLVGGSDGKFPSMIPFSMWPPGMPVPSEAAMASQVQRFPLPSHFLAASNPWLRGGMIPGLPFRPALYPAGPPATTLDPNNPYKAMLGLPFYPFPSGNLQAQFPTPAFSSAPSSQPQTPSSISSTPGFLFGQYSLPSSVNAANTLRGMSEVQSRLTAGGTPPLVQHPSFPGGGGGKDGKQRASPESNQDAPQPQPQQPWPMIPGMPMLQAPFGFGVQGPLVSSVAQASQLNLLAPRGPVPLSTSPLTLATQSVAAGSGGGGDSQLLAMEAYHSAALAGRRPKKQTGSAIDLTGREQMIKHIEAPSPQEAVKMATQKISPFPDQSRFSPKLKSLQDTSPIPPSSSPLILPSFVNNPNAPLSQSQGAVLSYPILSGPGGVGNSAINMPNMPGHLINPSQLVGVALPGGHMIPMNYPAISNLSGKAEEGVVGKKRSPKRGGGAGQKLRIHQMDFKQQGKVDRRRRRPWKSQEKMQEEEVARAEAKQTAATPAQSVTEQPPSSSTAAAAAAAAVAAAAAAAAVAVGGPPSEDNYALNMLADCSSKEGANTKHGQGSLTSQQKQDMDVKRMLMRSPGSLAGANSLLLLAKPDPISPSAAVTRQRASPPENAVIDSLLKLSNSPVPTTSSSSSTESPGAPPDKPSAATARDESRVASESRTQSAAAAEAILMMGKGGQEREAGGRKDTDGRGPALLEVSDHSEEKEKGDADSERTDTDSEATLSPTTPAPTVGAACRWPPQASAQATHGTRHEEKLQTSTAQKPSQEFVKPTDIPPRRALEIVQTVLRSPSPSLVASNNREAVSVDSSASCASTTSETPLENSPRPYTTINTTFSPPPGQHNARSPPPPGDLVSLVSPQEDNAGKSTPRSGSPSIIDRGKSGPSEVAVSDTQLQVESKEEERDLLGLGASSSRLQMIDDEEDADVDVENIDSSILDEPELNSNTAERSKSPAPASAVDTAEPQPPASPENPPTPPLLSDTSPRMQSPLPPHPLLVATTPCLEDKEEDELVNEAEEKIQEGEVQLAGKENEEVQADIDVPPPKRPRVEEKEQQPVDEFEPEERLGEEQLGEVMESEAARPPQSPTADTAATPPPSSPPAPVSPVPPSSSVAVPSLTSEPLSLPSPADDAKEPGEATEPCRDETAGSSNSRSDSRLGDYPVEPLSPTHFPDELSNTSLCMDEQIERFEETTPQVAAEVREEDFHPPPSKASVSPTSLAQGDSVAVDMNHDSTAGTTADDESACISWPAEESDKQSPARLSEEALLRQKGSPKASVTQVNAAASTNCSENHRETVAFTDLVSSSKVPSRSVSPAINEKALLPPMSDQKLSAQKSLSPQPFPDVAQLEKTSKLIKPDSSSPDALQMPSNSVRKTSPPIGPQNRLPVGKSVFDRHQQHRKLLQHSHKQLSRDEKSIQSKKWSRGVPESGSRARGLFDVDPQEGRRQKTENSRVGGERESVEHAESRKTTKPRLPPPSHGHPNKQSAAERAKFNSRSPRSFSSDEPSHRHSRPQDSSRGGHTWEQRDSGKQKVRPPPARQGSRFSPLSPSEHSLSHPKDRDETTSVSDEEQARVGRVRPHQNSHGWREDHQPSAEHTRDRGHVLSSKHKSDHRSESKQGFEHGRKIARIEKERDQRKYPSTTEPNAEERCAGYKRHRDEDSDHSSSTRLKLSGARKRSYESVSEDELPEDSNLNSSRESSLVSEDRARSERRSSLDAAEQHSSTWRKERKRTPEACDDSDEHSRISKHKKHKHGSKEHNKEHKERRKWRKTDGNDHKLKRVSEEKPWHGYHKH